MNGTTPYEATFDLKAASHVSIGSSAAPADWMVLADRYIAPNNYGPLEGGSEGTYIVWYLYVARDPQAPKSLPMLPETLKQGTVELPAMTINGQHYEAQKLKFKRESFAGFEAVNC
jgi:hypothetical protein